MEKRYNILDLTAIMKFTLAIQKSQVEIGKIYHELNNETDETLDYLQENKIEYFVPAEIAAETFKAYVTAEMKRYQAIESNVTAVWKVIENIFENEDSDELCAFADAVEFMANENFKHHNAFMDVATAYREFIEQSPDGVPRDEMLDMLMSLNRLSEGNLRLTVGCFKKINKAYENLTGNSQ